MTHLCGVQRLWMHARARTVRHGGVWMKPKTWARRYPDLARELTTSADEQELSACYLPTEPDQHTTALIQARRNATACVEAIDHDRHRLAWVAVALLSLAAFCIRAFPGWHGPVLRLLGAIACLGLAADCTVACSRLLLERRAFRRILETLP